MSADREWSLLVLNQLRGQYIELVRAKVLPAGVCWLLKENANVQKKIPNVVTVTKVANIPKEETHQFWKPLGKAYATVVENYFLATAVVRKFGNGTTIIFRTPKMDAALETPDGSRLATKDLVKHFTIRPPRKLPVQRSPEGANPESASPSHNLRKATPLSSHMKRPGPVVLPAVFLKAPAASPPKKFKADTARNYRPIQIDADHLQVKDNWAYLSQFYSQSPVTNTETAKNNFARIVVSALDGMLSN